MKFITDGMFGKLTRWLRMLGYDVKYLDKHDDHELIEIAHEERRILLTRDLELYRQGISRGIEVFFVEGKTEEDKLAELVRRFKIKLDIDMITSRCPKCNTRIRAISKEEIKDRIKNATFFGYDDFWECSKCKQVYWQGAHWEKILMTLKKAKQKNINSFDM
ncbi:MAG: Mut7-C RNAse domain-containing protein [Candidatus Bathyarchaeota archaeon]